MAEKWTPGPWRVQESPKGSFLVKAGDSGFNVCRIDKSVTYVMDFDEKAEPDAHLIAAAPELYEALDWLINAHSEGVPYGVLKSKAKAALAKARGEQ